MLFKNAQDFGDLIKKTRKASQITQVDLAAACGTGVRFIRDLEKGKTSCEIEKALLVATMLGIQLEASLPLALDNIEGRSING